MKIKLSLIAFVLILPFLATYAAAEATLEHRSILPADSSHPPIKPGDANFPAPDHWKHEDQVNAVRSGSFDLVMIGDSITEILYHPVSGKYQTLRASVWEKYYAPRKAINLGYSGRRTEQLLWRLQNGELDFKTSPKLFTILIGTNNIDDRNFPKVHTPEEVLTGTKAIVDLIRQKHPFSKILLFRILPRGGDTEKSLSPPHFYSSAKSIALARRAGELTATLADGKNVFWLDVGHIFLRPDGAINTDRMWDLLHPSPAGALAWTKEVIPTIDRLMGATSEPDTRPVSVIPVPRRDGGYDWNARHAAAVKAKTTNPQFVFIGDSITHHLGGTPAPTGPFLSHRGDAFWQAVGDKACGCGLNLGFGADWTQHILWRLENGELDSISPKFVVLMAGTNNVLWGNGKADEIVAGVRECVLRIRAKTPEAQLILMGVPPCRNPATHPNRLLAAKVNESLKQLAEEAKAPFLDLTPKFLDANGNIPAALMDDAIHPTPAGYEIWQDALLPLLTNDKPCIANTPAKHVWPDHPWWPGRFAEKCKLAREGGFDVMLIGDSITHGIEQNADNGIFKTMLAPATIGNFGDAGDTTENVLWRLDNGQLDGKLNPKVVMLMIGTNNTRCRMDPPAEIASGVETIVNRLTTRLPQTQVLLLGIFPFGHAPTAATRVNNAKTNEILAKLDGSVGGRVHYLDLTPKFLDADGNLPASLMPDFLHPNADGYIIWANAVVPEIRNLLGNWSR